MLVPPLVTGNPPVGAKRARDGRQPSFQHLSLAGGGGSGNG